MCLFFFDTSSLSLTQGKVSEFSADFVNLHLRIRIVYKNDDQQELKQK